MMKKQMLSFSKIDTKMISDIVLVTIILKTIGGVFWEMGNAEDVNENTSLEA